MVVAGYRIFNIEKKTDFDTITGLQSIANCIIMPRIDILIMHRYNSPKNCFECYGHISI